VISSVFQIVKKTIGGILIVLAFSGKRAKDSTVHCTLEIIGHKSVFQSNTHLDGFGVSNLTVPSENDATNVNTKNKWGTTPLHYPAIQRAAQQLARKSKDPLDFARKAYNYVGDNFKYRFVNTTDRDWTLATTLQRGSSDCGGLSSVFISLLRSRGIPARFICAVHPVHRRNYAPHDPETHV